MKENQTPAGTTQSELKHYSDLFTANKNGVIPKRILVQGQTGIGKSTFVKKLLVDWVEVNKAAGDEQSAVLKNFELVVAVNLKEVSKCQSLKDVITLSNVFAKEDKYMTEGLVDYISNNQEKVLLIFDGYDEYRSGLDSEIHEIFSGNSLRNCCVLITTRISKADELRGAEDLHAEITGFSEVDREQFMRRFLNSEEVSNLQAHLYTRELEELAKVPLLLLLFCILWKEGQSKSFPKSKTKLYVDIVQFILNHSHSKQTADKTKTKQYVELKSFKEILSEIGKVALQSLLNDDHLLEYSQLSDSVHCDDSVFIGLLQITEYSETLRPTGMVSFIHKSIQEFLAAWYITYKCIPEGGNLGEIGVKLEECLDVQNVFQFMCGLSDDGALAALRHFKSVRISDPSLDLSKAIPHGGNKKDVPLNVVTSRQWKFNDMVLNSFGGVESKAELSHICLDCLGSVLLSSQRSLPKELVIKATDTNFFSLIIRKIGESLKIVKILVSKSSKTFDFAVFLEKLENSLHSSLCHCWFASILCCRNGRVCFYITDLSLMCLHHARLFFDKVNFSVLSSALNFLRCFNFDVAEYFDDSICHLLEQISNPHRCFYFIERCFLTLTSKGAVKFASLLPRFQKVICLHLHLAECSADAVSKLIAAITEHKSLEVLQLSESNLTSAEVESLSQSLPELTALRTLSLGCLTECSDEAVTKLVTSIKYKSLDQLCLFGNNLTSAAAEALGQLLPVLSALRTLSLGSLTECSDEAVTKLVVSIKHKNLHELYLHGINLTSAVAEELGQLLREPSYLQTLQLCGSDGCTLWLNCERIFISQIPTQKISGLTESSAEVVLSLIEGIKKMTFWKLVRIRKLEMSNIALTSAVAEALAQLLPELSALQTLSVGASTECSDEAVTRLVATTKHETLEELYLSGINLTPAAAEALGQSLPELSSLQTLRISGSVGCSLQHKELETVFGRFNRPSSLTELSITGVSARGSLGSIANKLCFFPNLGVLVLEDLDMGEADLSDLLENLKFTPYLHYLHLEGNPLGHAVRSMVPYLIEQQKLEVVYFRRGDCSEEDFKYVQEAVKGKRLRLTIKPSWL